MDSWQVPAAAAQVSIILCYFTLSVAPDKTSATNMKKCCSRSAVITEAAVKIARAY